VQLALVNSWVVRKFASSIATVPPVRKVASGIATIPLVVLAVALAAVLVPRLLGYGTVVVTSGSMGGAVPIGSLAVLEHRNAVEIEEGDVIVSRQGGVRTEVLHRVVSVRRDGSAFVVRTKGDANAEPDPQPYTLPSRVPVELYSLPTLGYLVGFSKTPAGWFLLICLPAAIIGALILRAVWAQPAAARGTAGLVSEPLEGETSEQPGEPVERDGAESDEREEELAAFERSLDVAVRERELEERADELERRARAIAEAERSLLAREASLVEREAAARGAESKRAELRAQLESVTADSAERRAELAPAQEAWTAEPDGQQPGAETADEAGHLLFVPLYGRYTLVFRPGAAPARGALVVLGDDGDGRRFVAAKVGRSPLPSDPRRCAFLDAVAGPEAGRAVEENGAGDRKTGSRAAPAAGAA
jgi:signal peptidase